MIHHVPEHEVAARIAQGWIPLSQVAATAVQPRRGALSVSLALLALVFLVAVFLVAWWAMPRPRAQSDANPLVLVPTIARPTPLPTAKPAPVSSAAGPGIYQCQMCEADGGCHGFRSGTSLAFGGGLTEALGWNQYAANGDTVTITTSGPFGVEAVYRGCRKIGG